MQNAVIDVKSLLNRVPELVAVYILMNVAVCTRWPILSLYD